MSSLAELVARRIAPEAGAGIGAGTGTGDDPDLAALVERVQREFGGALAAVFLYGSYSRGERDSLTDLYVLIDDYGSVDLAWWHGLLNRALPPNVYQLELDTGMRCKYALLPIRQFERCIRRDFHSYFWARFAQPTRLLYTRDAEIRQRLVTTTADAVRRFHTEVAQVITTELTAVEFWQTGLQLTYACELRAESSRRAADLVGANADYFTQLTSAIVSEPSTEEFDHEGRPRAGSLLQLVDRVDPVKGQRRWWLRRWWGKLLSVARLLKASATFNDGFNYLLWKIERHSGIYVEPGPWAQRLPLLFGWRTFFRLYRLGAFR